MVREVTEFTSGEAGIFARGGENFEVAPPVGGAKFSEAPPLPEAKNFRRPPLP